METSAQHDDRNAESMKRTSGDVENTCRSEEETMKGTTSGYYEEISRVYDSLFPVSSDTLDFLCKAAGPLPTRILDVACGNAGYSMALARKGHDVLGVDLDTGMIREAQLRMQSLPEDMRVSCRQGDMLMLDTLGLPAVGMAFCIGNSLVHLPNPAAMRTFLSSVHGLMVPDALLVLQIINYDRILDADIRSLQTIRPQTGEIVFERLYETIDMTGNQQEDNESALLTKTEPLHATLHEMIRQPLIFHTKLHVNGSLYESRIPLYPIRSGELVDLLLSAGFKDIRTYGDFKETPFQCQTSYALVITART